ncbi:hypothetical protein ABW20_dc0109337 [Dactylellina cionopaga]|nr:hypothetical protein ABW20_dc0109337 [Dactylellina cionopaga]
MDVYEAPSQARNCAPLSLFMNYNALNFSNIGFGTGWSFNLSTYQHRQAKVLNLATGESYQVLETNSSISVRDQKLKRFEFKRLNNGDYHQVTRKSGQDEILSNTNDTYNVCVSIRLYAANGRSLQLTWIRSGDTPWLSKISDCNQDLLQITYGAAAAKVIRAPNTANESILTFNFRKDNLYTVQLPLDNDPSWTFTYERFGVSLCMTEVKSPTGLAEETSYKPNGHRLPTGAPFAYMPYAIAHTAIPANGQPATTLTYSYSDQNFLGYNGAFNWQDGQDNLYQAPASYDYTNTISDSDGATTKYTYNKYHLLTRVRKQKRQIKLPKI